MLLSIITINYNNGLGLEKTLISVLDQSEHSFEHIIVDGSSSDGSVNVIKTYVDKVDNAYPIKWVSETDSGIYNAMNKGIQMASGDYIQFLNSGDALVNKEVVSAMYAALITNGNPPILIGNMIKSLPNGKVLRDRALKHDEVTMLTFYQGTLNHSPAYINKTLFETYGMYDESLKIVSDWKWYLEVVGLKNVPVHFVDIDVTLFDMGGISETNVSLCKDERRQILVELLPATVLIDYDRWHFAIDQKKRIMRFPVLNYILYVFERIIFKYDKHKHNVIRR